MSIKLNLGINKKIGEPNYGSRGASCHVEFELDGSLDNGAAARFQEAARRAYAACRHVVESELAAGDSHSQLRTTGHTNAPNARKDQSWFGRSCGKPCSHGDRRSGPRDLAIADRQQVDLLALLRSQFGVDRPDDLSIISASSLIDQLKASAGEGACS